MIRWLTLLLFLSWLLFYWQGGFKILADIRSAFRSGASQLDAFLLVVLAVLGLGMTLTAVWAALNWAEPAAGDWLAAPGFFLTLTGVTGTFYCRAVLGKFWTAETACQSGHAIIDSGPYSMVRHPIYLFAILLYSGLGLAFPAWWNLLAVVGIALGYALKARDEEKFLERVLAGYADYEKRVRWRLLPGVW